MNDDIKNTTLPESNENETSEVPSEKDTIKNYRLIMDTIKEVDEQCLFIEKFATDNIVNTYHVSPKIFPDIIKYDIDNIPDTDPNELREFMNRYYEDQYKQSAPLEDMPDHVIADAMYAIKKASLMVLSAKRDAQKVKENTAEVFSDYVNYLSSDEVKKSREARLKLLKEQAETETDEISKKKIMKLINTMEQSLDFSFLFKRFEKYGEKEVLDIKNAFFDDKKGSYHISRYENKIKKFGYNPDIYKRYFNIEEDFLDEKYHPFNNLFLYIYIKMVAYSDPYNNADGMFVRSLTAGLANLIYHRFSSTESEDKFKEIISSVLDKFMPFVEEFKANNRTYKNNEERKKVEQNYNEKRRALLTDKLNLFNLAYDENASIDELQKIYNDYVDALQTEQLDKYDAEKVKIQEDGEGMVSIAPTLNKVMPDIPTVNPEDSDVEDDNNDSKIIQFPTKE